MLHEALSDPGRAAGRPWLRLIDEEQAPRVLQSSAPHRLVWSSLWPQRPDARIVFDLVTDGGSGTLLSWTLLVDEPMPGGALLGHLRKRLNQLINADLRHSFGQ